MAFSANCIGYTFSFCVLIVHLLFSNESFSEGIDYQLSHGESRHKMVDIANELKESGNPFDGLLSDSILAGLGDSAAYENIRQYVFAEDPVLQRAAIDTMISIDGKISRDYLEKISSEDLTLYKLIVSSLASLPRNDMGSLLNKALNDQDEELRLKAIKALSLMPNNSAASLLIDIAEDEEEKLLTRLYALNSAINDEYEGITLEQLTSVSDIINQNNDVKMLEIIAVLSGKIDSLGSRSTLERLMLHEEPRVSAAALISAYALDAERYSDNLITLIISGNPYSSYIATAGIRRLPSDIAFQLTSKLISNSNLSDQSALRLLESWSLVDSHDIQMIVEWGLLHPNLDIKLMTLWLAGERKSKSYMNKVEIYLGHEELLVRGMAAWAMGKLIAN